MRKQKVRVKKQGKQKEWRYMFLFHRQQTFKEIHSDVEWLLTQIQPLGFTLQGLKLEVGLFRTQGQREGYTKISLWTNHFPLTFSVCLSNPKQYVYNHQNHCRFPFQGFAWYSHAAQKENQKAVLTAGNTHIVSTGMSLDRNYIKVLLVSTVSGSVLELSSQ